MKLKADMLSKKALAEILEAMRPHIVGDELLAAAIRKDMTDRYNDKLKKTKALQKWLLKEGKRLEKRPATQKRLETFNSQLKKYNRDAASLREMFETIHQIEKHFDIQKIPGVAKEAGHK